MQEGVAIGTINLRRDRGRSRSPDEQIALLQTFADQAVIAIENVRLFTELEARNTRAAGRARAADGDQRGAQGDRPLARSISSRCFETLAENAVRLCEAEQAVIFRFDGQRASFLVAIHNLAPRTRARRAESRSRPGAGRAIGTGRPRAAGPIHIHDVRTDPEYSCTTAHGSSAPIRTVLAIPMLQGRTSCSG